MSPVGIDLADQQLKSTKKESRYKTNYNRKNKKTNNKKKGVESSVGVPYSGQQQRGFRF